MPTLRSMHGTPGERRLLGMRVGRDSSWAKSVSEARRDFRRMAAVDQRIRRRIEYYTWSPRIPSSRRPRLLTLWVKKREACDRRNAPALRRLLRRFGWPPLSIFGKEAVNCAFALALHNHERAFRAECLALIIKAHCAGEADPFHYAYFWDNTALEQNRKQRFGTHFVRMNGNEWGVLPIEDVRQAAALRRQLGLCSIREEMRQQLLFEERLDKALNGEGAMTLSQFERRQWKTKDLHISNRTSRGRRPQRA
jgi:hypothetical protein